jgi:single-stranded DNA-binding protein
LLEVEVLEAPQLRYPQENQAPLAEMLVRFDGLRPEDPAGQIRVVGWGNLAQDLANRVQVGQRLVIEGRLRMNTVPRPDGVKEKRAEFTLARLHPLAGSSADAFSGGSAGMSGGLSSSSAPAAGQAPASGPAGRSPAPAPQRRAPAAAPGGDQRSAQASAPPAAPAAAAAAAAPVWNSSPLVPDDLIDGEDEIPF